MMTPSRGSTLVLSPRNSDLYSTIALVMRSKSLTLLALRSLSTFLRPSMKRSFDSPLNMSEEPSCVMISPSIRHDLSRVSYPRGGCIVGANRNGVSVSLGDSPGTSIFSKCWYAHALPSGHSDPARAFGQISLLGSILQL